MILSLMNSYYSNGFTLRIKSKSPSSFLKTPYNMTFTYSLPTSCSPSLLLASSQIGLFLYLTLLEPSHMCLHTCWVRCVECPSSSSCHFGLLIIQVSTWTFFLREASLITLPKWLFHNSQAFKTTPCHLALYNHLVYICALGCPFSLPSTGLVHRGNATNCV